MRLLPILLTAVALAACGGGGADLPALATRTALPAPGPPVAALASGTATDAASGPGPSDGLRRLDLPEVTDGAVVDVDVRRGDRSFLVAVRGTTPSALVGIAEVVDPTGRTRYAADLRRGVVVVDDLETRVVADEGAVGMYVVAAEGLLLEEGTWTLEVATNEPSAAVGVVFGPGGAVTDRRHLDIVVWATADVADTHAVAAAWREAAEVVLGPHGLGIGRLDVVPAGATGQPFAILGVDGLAGEVHDACAAAHEALDPPPRTAVVVLADRILEGAQTASAEPDGNLPAVAQRRADGDIGGFTASTPGTTVIGPTSHACVAVSTGTDPADRGLTAVHEVLHLVGLTGHTTESDGRTFDRVADTAECRLEDADADHDLRVSADECTAHGADNLMFWAEGGTALTAGQVWRIRWHPLMVTG